MATPRATVPAGNVAFVDKDGVLTSYGRNLLVQLLKNTTGVISGAGVPSLSAPKGTLYLNTTGSSTSTRVYVNTNGSTGWTNLVAAT